MAPKLESSESVERMPGCGGRRGRDKGGMSLIYARPIDLPA